MNKLTQEIAQWLNISVDDAFKVQEEMVIWGADFSEDSTKALKMTARMAYAEMQKNGEFACAS